MPADPAVAHTRNALDSTLLPWRTAGATVALVPTMGALHAGHLALVRAAQERADRVVVSIFVNPEQFAAHEDFGTYPRTLPSDLAMLAPLGVDLVWAPEAGEMYPPGFATRITPGGAALAGLEDAVRPHFFGGVCTIVAKLLMQVRPDFAMFGEKDFQQLAVVTAMARDLDTGARIVGMVTVREPDGLALSSRNAYLSATERAQAPTLYRVLQESAAAIRDGSDPATVLANGRGAVERAGVTVDYLELRDAVTLAPVVEPQPGTMRLLIAARIGRTRLIDNVAV